MTPPRIPEGLARAVGGNEEWDPFAYFLARGQEVAEEDAQAIARCMEDALSEVPDQVVPMQGSEFGRGNTLRLIKAAAEGVDPPANRTRAAVEILSGPPKSDARALIGFLSQGGFTVHPTEKDA